MIWLGSLYCANIVFTHFFNLNYFNTEEKRGMEHENGFYTYVKAM